MWTAPPPQDLKILYEKNQLHNYYKRSIFRIISAITYVSGSFQAITYVSGSFQAITYVSGSFPQLLMFPDQISGMLSGSFPEQSYYGNDLDNTARVIVGKLFFHIRFY